MKLIAEGAEAKIFEDKKVIIKQRIKKSYRIQEIDEKLRKSRTKHEQNILKKLSHSGFSPKLIETKDFDTLIIEKIDGKKLRDVLSINNYGLFAAEIGKSIKKMHDLKIIHGDLTTSNMMVGKNNKLFLIDFGLSYISERLEDKAVDLHMLKQTLESRHFDVSKQCFQLILKHYNDKEVLTRLAIVEKRGKNKGS